MEIREKMGSWTCLIRGVDIDSQIIVSLPEEWEDQEARIDHSFRHIRFEGVSLEEDGHSCRGGLAASPKRRTAPEG